MNIPEYISSGVLEDYCLGALSDTQMAEVEAVCAKHPEVKEELVSIQKALEGYVTEQPVWRKAALKSPIWETLSNINLEEEAVPGKFPIINKYSDHNNWLKMVAPLKPKDFKEGTYIDVIQHNEQVTQMLVMSYIGQDEEEHDDLKECFMILEGECECNIGGKIIPLKAGGFIDIPLHTSHSVRVMPGSCVTAIMQRIAIAV